MERVDEIGLIHASAPPETVASVARIIIGLMIGNSSVIIICGMQCEELHIVTILNRIEYRVVVPTLNNPIKVISMLVGEYSAHSIIISLE